MPNPPTSRYEQIVTEQTRRFAVTVGTVSPDTIVPTCPEWDVTELAQHVGQTQLFYTNMINDQASSPAEFRWPEETIPGNASAWSAWLAGTCGGLIDAVRSAGPDGPVWNPMGEQSGGVTYWLRRAFGELAAHRFDACTAAGQTYDLEPTLAADAISEFAEMVTSPTWAMNMPSAIGMRGSGQTLWWSATDVEFDAIGQTTEWLFTKKPDGALLERHGPTGRSADVTVDGPASALLPLLIHRTSIAEAITGGVHVSGDREMLFEWLELMKY